VLFRKTLYRSRIENQGTFLSDDEPQIGPREFLFYEMIGKGAFGEVYLVEKRDTEKEYAMKIMRKEFLMNQNMMHYIKHEKDILSIMQHPFIVRLNFAF
jgi:protein-serine/threonine kinase